MTRRLVLVPLFAGLAAGTFSPSLRAQESPPATPPPAVSDASLRAVKDRQVAVRLRDGTEAAGTLLAFEADSITLVAPFGEVRTVSRADVVALRLIIAQPVPNTASPPPSAPPGPERHFAVGLGIVPGIAIDVDYGLFHGFANYDIVFPLASGGNWQPASLGLGAGFKVSPSRPALRLDLFGHLNVMSGSSLSTNNGVVIAFGAGLGLHYTWNNGITLGFTVPLVGYSVAITSSPIYFNNYTASAAVANYYFSSALALPLGFLGYRF